MYQIIFNNSVCCENYIPKSKVKKALEYWKTFGMTGAYTSVMHSPSDLLQRVW